MKYYNFLKTIIATAIFCVINVPLSGQYVNQNGGNKVDPRETNQKLATTMYIIDNFYVDSTYLSKLTEEAIIAMLKELDPHSAYISKKDVEKTNEPLVGSFEGIGVTFQLLRDTILVISPVSGGPSERVGIMAGDKIIKIDGEDAFGKKVNNDYVFKHLRGEKGTKVTISIKRGDNNELIDFDVIRDKIPLNSIDAAFMVDKNIGYIKLDRFAQNSVQEFEESLSKLRQQKMKSLILDLRGNSGGYLNTAIDLSNEFLTEGKTIVFTEGMKSPKQVFETDKKGQFADGNLVVLIDEGSASASEIVSGAIQDWDRGVLIGRRSFGKGLVQRPFNLPDGSMIRLTTARYHTPTGRCIQRSYENGADDYFQEMTKRLKHGEYYHADSIQFPDSLRYETLISGRHVYGGGGIMPDIFMPADTSFSSKLYTDLIRKGVFNRYTVDYVMDNREIVKKKYKDFESYNDKFIVSDNMIEDFKVLAAKEGVEWNDEQYLRSEKMIKMVIKALIARNEWDMEKYYQVTLLEDPVMKEAIDILKNDDRYKSILKK